MSKNIELKAYWSDMNRARHVCAALGAHLARNHCQRDTYFAVRQDRLKLRESDKFGSCLIYYRRIDDPSLRESSYTKIDLSDNASAWRDLLSNAVGIRIVVEKHRETFVLNSALINLDTISELGSFIEIEVHAEKCGDQEALSYAQQLKKAFDISEIDIVPWSYSDLLAAYQNAKRWRAELASPTHAGQLFLIDGPSASGKSTLAARVGRTANSSARFARRHCTRQRRVDEEDEYIFVSYDEFQSMARAGQFVEHRNFEFGMSYGLAWDEAMPPLMQGKNVIAIMNWGNASHVRRIFPPAKVILAKASQDTLRRRLLSRRIHNEAQLEERLTNASRFSGHEELYDLIVSNEDGELEKAVETISRYVSAP
jgi:predicted adenylyl cyclase CyaB